MKLIDILVRELPKLGGWPDGVTKISQDYYGDIWCWRGNDYGTVKSYGRISEIADNHRKQGKDESRDCFVTREQYEAALAASKPEWDGECPIPAGTEVEVHFEGDDSRVWTRFRVEYMAGEIVVLHDYRIDNVDAYKHKTLSFRPIRSEADKRRDEIIEALKEGLGHAHGLYDLMQIYHLLNNGKIPHIRID